MSGGLERAYADWQREVEGEAARLIERGWSPWEAYHEGERSVKERRRRAAAEADRLRQILERKP